MYGHIAPACRLPKRQGNAEIKSTDVMVVESERDNMMIPMSANGVQFSALLDTGSPYMFMDTALYDQIRLPRCSHNRIPLIGFGGRTTYSLGENKVNFTIDNNDIELCCQIVPNGLMSYRME